MKLVFTLLSLMITPSASCLKWHVSVLLGRIGLHLVLRHLQCLYQAFAGLLRQDDFVNESQFGSLIGGGKLLFVGIQLLAFVSASALRNRMFTAPSAPITAISALG